MSNYPLTVDHLSAHGFQLWRASFYNMPQPHVHTDIEIVYVYEGYAHLLHGGQIYELPAHSWSIIWAGIPHRVIEISHQNRGFWLTLPLSWAIHWDLPGNALTRLLTGELLLDPADSPGRIAHDQYLLDLWYQEYQSGDEERLKNIALNVESLLRRMQREPAGGHRWKPVTKAAVRNAQFNRILDYISGSYPTIDNVAAIAKAVELHPKYLMQLFKKVSGINLWEYVIWLRVAHAQRLLLTTDAAIVDIALASGFNSPSTFYQAFKKFSGDTTPRQFRQQRIV